MVVVAVKQYEQIKQLHGDTCACACVCVCARVCVCVCVKDVTEGQKLTGTTATEQKEGGRRGKEETHRCTAAGNLVFKRTGRGQEGKGWQIISWKAGSDHMITCHLSRGLMSNSSSSASMSLSISSATLLIARSGLSA